METNIGGGKPMESYWGRYAGARLSRRRLLSGAVAGGAGLALLACGGSGNGSGDKSATASLLGKAEDTTKKAVAGGNWPDYMPEDIVNMDPILNNASPT